MGLTVSLQRFASRTAPTHTLETSHSQRQTDRCLAPEEMGRNRSTQTVAPLKTPFEQLLIYFVLAI